MTDTTDTTNNANDFDAKENASILSEVFKENNVYLGGSAIGKGFRRSARYFLQSVAPQKNKNCAAAVGGGGGDDDHANAASLIGPEDDIVNLPPEDPFYVVDLGVVVYQYYNWCRHFPRVQPYYAVKCNPDPVVIKTLALLGANFDCASRQEIQMVRTLTKDLPHRPDIIYANPCKARAHILEALRCGVSLMTFDNEEEVRKCASISTSTTKKIKLVLRIITDDTGASSRLSLKFGAPRSHWRTLLATAKECGMDVVGISFHVGSGCKDQHKYELALRDARELFDMAKQDFGFHMHILDIGGGFPGETHSLWNPELRDATTDHEKEDDENDEEDFGEEKKDGSSSNNNNGSTAAASAEESSNENPVLFFNEIAESVAPILDELFPESSGVSLIAEPGRYLVASCATLLVNVTSMRKNILHADNRNKVQLHPYSDREAAEALHLLTREEEGKLVHDQGGHTDHHHPLFRDMMKEMKRVSERFARQTLTQQEVDVFGDRIDLTATMNQSIASFDSEDDQPVSLLFTCAGEEKRKNTEHTAEGISIAIVNDAIKEDDDDDNNDEKKNQDDNDECNNKQRDDCGGAPNSSSSGSSDFVALAAAGEAAVAGAFLEAVSTVMPGTDDFAYYVNDGVYGAFNCIMFDHAVVRPRLLRNMRMNKAVLAGNGNNHQFHHRRVKTSMSKEGFQRLLEEEEGEGSSSDNDEEGQQATLLYSSTIFGPSCDSIDVVSRSVLLPKLSVGDWLYFTNMGAYTSAAASTFNGFDPSDKFYVCSVRPENFEKMVAGP